MSLSISYLSPFTLSADNKVILLKNMIAHRFLRLSLPIAMTSIIIVMLINTSLMANLNIGNQFANQWIALFYHFKKISVSQWFSFSFYDAIILHGTDENWLAKSISPVLWTMPIEFTGSMLVFFVIFLFNQDKKRWGIYIILALYFIYFKSYMFHFILGIIASELYVKYMQLRDRINSFTAYNYISLGSLFALLILYGLYGISHLSGVVPSGLASFSIIILCITNAKVIRFLEKPVFLFWGEICFTLYLIHLPVIFSFSSFMVIKLENLPTLYIICIVGFLTIAICLVSAWLLRFAERALMRLYKKVIVLGIYQQDH